jgi:hypothetical protein
VLLLASAGLRQASGGLAIAGAFCLVGCLAMLMRTGMAEGSGEPIPDDSPPGVLPKIGRSIARSEREKVPLYQRSWQVLLAVGLVLFIAAGWAIAASVIGPFPAIVAVAVAAWIILILYVRASQKSLTTLTSSGESWDLVMAPRGVPLVSLTNRPKTWLHTPAWVIDHNLQHFGEWEVIVEHKSKHGTVTWSDAQILSPRVEAAHRFRQLARDFKSGQFPAMPGEP